MSPMEAYSKFVRDLVYGGLTGYANEMVKKYAESIIEFYNEINTYQNPEGELSVLIKKQTIYRGIVLEDNNLTKLQPHENFHYLSFSEDINIAKEFARPGSLSLSNLGNYGYLITLEPKDYTTLAHYKINTLLNLYWDKQGIPDRIASLRQQEVTILQPLKSLKLIQIF